MTGGVHWRLSNGESVSPLENLEWSQQLALLLIYCSHEGLADCVRYLITDTNDVEYHLLAEHSSWQTLSACSTELEAWFLHQSLVSYGAISNDNKSDVLHGIVCAQLATQDIKWAIFVALHIRDTSLRSFAVEEILGRRVNQITSQIESWLQKTLSLHKRIIAQAKATGFISTFKYEPAAKALLDAGRWQEAHDILVEHVFPELVINEESKILGEYIKRLKGHRDHIAKWSNGGNIYDVYVRCVLDQDLNGSILNESCNVHLLNTSNNRQVLCQSEMARRINLIMVQTEGNFPLNAPIPDDYALTQLRHNTRNMLDALC
jgi:hypothetical protein